MAHAVQIRTRSCELLKEGFTQESVAKIMGVGVHSVRRWRDEFEKHGKIGCFYNVSNRKATKLPENELRAYFAENPDALLKEAAEKFGCDPSSVFYACKRYRITYKKNKILYRKKRRRARGVQRNHRGHGRGSPHLGRRDGRKRALQQKLRPRPGGRSGRRRNPGEKI